MNAFDYLLTNIYEQMCCASIILGIVLVLIYWAINKCKEARWRSVRDVEVLRKRFEPRARRIIHKYYYKIFPGFVRKAPKCKCGYKAPRHPRNKPLTRDAFEEFFSELGTEPDCYWERIVIGGRMRVEEHYIEKSDSKEYIVCPKCHRILLNYTEAVSNIPTSRLASSKTGVWWYDAERLVDRYWGELSRAWKKLKLPSGTYSVHANSETYLLFKKVVRLIENDFS